MKNNKIYLITLLIALGFIVNSCDTNTEEYSPVSPVDSFVSTSAFITVDSDAVTFQVIVAASEAYTADRSVAIEVTDASTGSGLDYNFSGNLDILAGETTGSTTVKFNFDAIPSDIQKDLVLRLVSTSEEITISYTKICQSNDVKLSITFDRWSSETSWEITDSSNAVVETSGGRVYTPRADFDGVTIEEDFTLPDGDYTFTIFDQFSDGICCTFGNGSYKLEIPACTVVLREGGSFGGSESTTFSLP